MLYALGPGKIEKLALEHNIRFGVPLPERVLNRPFLLPGLELYYTGFLDLCSTRADHRKPISYTTMAEYCHIWELEQDQKEDFLWLVSRLDAVYLTEMGGQANGKTA